MISLCSLRSLAVLTLGALQLVGCGQAPPVQAISGLECSAQPRNPHGDRLQRAAAFLAKAKNRQDPASLAFGRRLSEFGRSLSERTSGAAPTVTEYVAAFEATLIAWERESGVDVQEARRRARGQIVLSLPREMGNGQGAQRVRHMRDSLLGFDGVRQYVEEDHGLDRGSTRLMQGTASIPDTVAFFADIEALALVVADTTRIGTATLSDAQTQYNLRVTNWSDTTRIRQLSDAHAVFDTLRLFIDEIAFAAWLADTSNLTPVYSVSGSCERGLVASLQVSQADACPPCWAVAVAVARVAGAGAAVGAIWEIGKGIVTGQGGGTDDIVEAAAVGAAGGVAGMGLGALLMSQYAVYGWGGMGAAIAAYYYMGQ